jgi:hypothetical protein
MPITATTATVAVTTEIIGKGVDVSGSGKVLNE